MIKYAKKLAPRGHVEIMEHAGFKARLMAAKRLHGEQVFGLPPGTPVPVYPIAALPAAPENWGRAAGTYVCPVSAEIALWFDFTMNEHPNTAILPSVKGMNPITGQKINTIDLEQYKDKCPIHGCNLSHERFCEECGYKWPPQNYVAAPNIAWLDGFRQPDGSVRQFFFTEDEQRDIASLVIGKENTVPAFGFAFFKRKNPVVIEKNIVRGQSLGHVGHVKYGTSSKSSSSTSNSTSSQSQFFSPLHTPNDWDDFSLDSTEILMNADVKALTSAMVEPLRRSVEYNVPDEKLKNKTVSVGAGAKIRQEIEPDPLDIKDWCDKESGIIRLYFVFEPQFKKMLKEGGIKDITGDDTGFLKGVPVG